jgi:3-oxo-5alpha-steroid 4-dehydrogenase
LAAGAVSTWDLCADVVVVGFGMAGTSAALGAAQAGASVVVLERASATPGTCGRMLYLGGGTAMQQAMGHRDSPDQMYRFLQVALGPGVDDAKLHAYCAGSVDHFNWLRELGVPLVAGPDADGSMMLRPDPDGYVQTGAQEYAGGGLVWTGGEQSYHSRPPVPRGHVPREPDGSQDVPGGAVLGHLARAVTNASTAVVGDAGAQRLVVDTAGRVVGVQARHFDSTILVQARRGVVLATGGFIFNDAMLRRYVPQLAAGVAKLGHDGQDGLGIQMAQLLGADAIHMDAVDVTMVTAPYLSFMSGVLVDRRGQRFINEDAYLGRIGNEVVLHRDAECYLVVDQDTFVESSWLRPAWVADTAAELERDIGLPSGSLGQTIDYYNEWAARGQDPLFGKQARWLKPLRAPLAAFDLRDERSPTSAYSAAGIATRAFTLGGLATDVAGRVLDVKARPIAGLYAAGRATSGLAVSGYCSGISLGDASFFGRAAGHAAATSRDPR